MAFLLKIYLIIVAETIFETTLLNVIVNEPHKKNAQPEFDCAFIIT